MVFKTIIQRNVRLSEAPSFGETIINYDATSKGATNHINLAQEIIDKNKKVRNCSCVDKFEQFPSLFLYLKKCV